MSMVDVSVENLPPESMLLGGECCDRCGAGALVRVVLTAINLPLLFCAHHYTRHAQALAPIAVRTHDHRPGRRRR